MRNRKEQAAGSTGFGGRNNNCIACKWTELNKPVLEVDNLVASLALEDLVVVVVGLDLISLLAVELREEPA